MRKILVFCFFVQLFISCQNKNIEVENEFYHCMNNVENYYNYRGELNDSIIAEFYLSIEYLSALSGIKANYTVAEPPTYLHKTIFLNDMKNWLNWFEINKHKISIEYSDSIKKEILKQEIWWKYDSKLNKIHYLDEQR